MSLGNNFLANLKRIVAIFAPIDALITKFQSDAVFLSEIIHNKDLLASYSKLHKEGVLTRKEFEYVVRMVESRKIFFISSPHRMAHLLDPRYCGEGLTSEERKTTERVMQWTGQMESEEVYRESVFFFFFHSQFFRCSNFLSVAKKEKEANSFEYCQLQAEGRSPAQYWDIETEYPLIQPLAKRLFALIVSSASSER